MRALAFALLLAVPALPLAARAEAPAGEPKTYGEKVAAGKALQVDQLTARPDDNAGKHVIVEGAVRAACTRKGCWMELAPSTDKGTQGCRVTFKDYGFFVPVDSAGAHARVEGTVEVKTVAPGQVAHYESEGAHFASKQKDGSARELRIIATGVELRR